MADSHYAPLGLWPGAFGMDNGSREATAAAFQGLLRQHNTLLAGGPSLFRWAGWIPTSTSGYLLWEQSGQGWEAVRKIIACNRSWGMSSTSLTMSLDGGTLAMSNAWFGDPTLKSEVLGYPIGDRIDWKLDYTNATSSPSHTNFAVSPLPFESLDEPSLEALGYLHDDRSAAGYGVSIGTMQRMQTGITTVHTRPLAVAHLGYVPFLRVGKVKKFITPDQPFMGTGKALVLAGRCCSASALAEIRLLVDGAEVAVLTGLPSSLGSVMLRTDPSVVIPPGLHTFAVYVSSLAANTDISSLSIYEVL